MLQNIKRGDSVLESFRCRDVVLPLLYSYYSPRCSSKHFFEFLLATWNNESHLDNWDWHENCKSYKNLRYKKNIYKFDRKNSRLFSQNKRFQSRISEKFEKTYSWSFQSIAIKSKFIENIKIASNSIIKQSWLLSTCMREIYCVHSALSFFVMLCSSGKTLSWYLNYFKKTQIKKNI